MKRPYSSITLDEAIQMVPARRATDWTIEAPPRAPSGMLTEYLRRLKSFDQTRTEAAQTLLIDAMLAEIVPEHPRLKVWKGLSLDTDSLTGSIDYLISPDYAYLSTPLLCVVEAKRDDFLQGQAQCIAGMLACRSENQEKGRPTDIHGIVSNGQGWQFFKLALTNQGFESELYATSDLPRVLGTLDAICSECDKALATVSGEGETV